MKGLAARFCWLLLLGLSLQAQGRLEPEYTLKAKVMLALLPYIEWPDQAAQRDRAFQLAVLGRSPFGSQLDQVAAPLTAHYRPIRIRYISKLQDAEGSQALFICASEAPRIEAILAWARKRQVLTLGDDEALATRGVMVTLVVEGSQSKKVKPLVNPEEARAAGLKVSSRLLGICGITSTRRGTP